MREDATISLPMVFGFQLTHPQHRGSVLPRVATSRAAGGAKIQLRPPTRGELAMLVLLCLCSAFLIGILLSSRWLNQSPMRFITGLIIVVAGTAGYAAQYVRKHRARSASITVAPWPLKLGDDAVVTFSSAHRGASLAAKLVCIEEAKRSSGKYEERKVALRFEAEIDARAPQWKLHIPEHELPSFSVKSNAVRWLLRVAISHDGRETPAEFELVVLPEVRA